MWIFGCVLRPSLFSYFLSFFLIYILREERRTFCKCQKVHVPVVSVFTCVFISVWFFSDICSVRCSGRFFLILFSDAVKMWGIFLLRLNMFGRKKRFWSIYVKSLSLSHWNHWHRESQLLSFVIIRDHVCLRSLTLRRPSCCHVVVMLLSSFGRG